MYVAEREARIDKQLNSLLDSQNAEIDKRGQKSATIERAKTTRAIDESAESTLKKVEMRQIAASK